MHLKNIISWLKLIFKKFDLYLNRIAVIVISTFVLVKLYGIDNFLLNTYTYKKRFYEDKHFNL